MVGKKLIPEQKKRGLEDACKFAEIDDELMEEKKKKIKLKMMIHEGEQKRFKFCPFPGCGKSFRSNRTADACLNKHLNILFLCVNFKFVMHNLNSFRNHICFAFSSGCKSMKRREFPGKPKREGVKKPKLEADEGDDVIVIDDE